MSIKILIDRPKSDAILDFGGSGNIKLFTAINENKMDTYVCAIDWLEMELNIEVCKSEVQSRKNNYELIFSPKEKRKFCKLLTNLCDTINQSLDQDNSNLIKYKMQADFISAPFWALCVMISRLMITKISKWSDIDHELYVLCQILYLSFGIQ